MEKIKDNDIMTDTGKKGKEIDILAMVMKLWLNRKTILIWCMWGVLAGLIIAFSIPREYTTKVVLAPEFKSRTSSLSGGLSAIASLTGMSSMGTSTTDAVYPQLYPDIVGSNPFVLSLLEVPVTDKKDKEYTVKEYIIDNTKMPWWTYVTGAPFKLMGLLRGGKGHPDELSDSLPVISNGFRMTPEEDGLVRALSQRVKANVDQKTNVITISVEMQDPVVSAMLADTVVARLREYVTNYRTDKARKDLEYAQKLNAEAQNDYFIAQQRLADYNDKNQNLATQSARVNRERLENESSLAFNLYNETSLQVQNAKSKVQENTPVFTEILPATVPLRPTSPRKGLIIGGFTFLGFVISCAWILFGNPVKEEYHKLKEMKNFKETTNAKDGDNKQ